jgi:hypothetical protein
MHYVTCNQWCDSCLYSFIETCSLLEISCPFTHLHVIVLYFFLQFDNGNTSTITLGTLTVHNPHFLYYVYNIVFY